MNKFFELFAKNVRSIIATAVVVLCFGFLYAILFITIPESNKEIVLLSAGIVLGAVMSVVGYYFGSSKDKSDIDKSDAEIARHDAGVVPPTIP